MKKNLNQSLQCPICNSLNISIKLKEKKKGEIIEFTENNSTKKIRNQTYQCKCNECGYVYEKEYGYEIEMNSITPTPINNLNDVKILSIYNSDSPLEKNYKIVSLEQSIYDENKNKKELVYLLFIEGEEFPILLSKETIDKIINDQPKVHTLIKKTCLERSRIQ